MSPDDFKPPTDEFGRDDPDAVERERRRREREAARQGARSELGSKVKRGRKAKKARKATEAAPGPPTDEKPPPRAPAPDPAPPPRQPRSLSGRAAAARDAARTRVTARRQTPQPQDPDPPSGGSAKSGGSIRRRRVIALGAARVGLLLVWFLIAFLQPFAGDGLGHDSIAVTIPDGSDAGKIADILADNGVVDNSTLFAWRLRLAGKSSDIQADTYNMAKGMSYGGAIDRLSGSKQGLASLAIPEGLSRPEIAELVSDAGVSGDYEAATVSSPGFKPAKYGAKNPPSLEGFLFPATYELDPGSTVDQLVPMQLQAFTQNIAKVNMRYAKTKNLTPYDVVIIASMVDREVMVPKERPLVAAVIYNRLHKNIPLGIDATTRFETGNFDQPLTSEQLQKDSPYNTRTRAGLTPGPIGNPGLAALKAAAAPAKVPFLYYVVKPGTCGEHTFVRTEAEFNAAVAKYNAARDAAGGNSPTSC
ncbi:MAG: endolytic transglycosylase MltG [Solirubrobacterales bacterium]